MNRLGRNVGRYAGEGIDVVALLTQILAAARRHGWTVTELPAATTEGSAPLLALTRPPLSAADQPPRFYLSTGIHGDEPAGPLALLRLLQRDDFPTHAWLWCCPCLNPTGFGRQTRESAGGLDLNRDYRDPRTPEVRAHVRWLGQQPTFDLALCLHEDWESAGFYLYELNPDAMPSLAGGIIEAVRPHCPVDDSSTIDGRAAEGGIIRPQFDPLLRPEWPEALYLIQNRTRLSYTLESPSDFELPLRVNALCSAVSAALDSWAPPRDREATKAQDATTGG